MKCCTKSATFLGMTETLQAQQGLVHLVADRPWEPQVSRVPDTASSLDFH